MKTVLSDIIVLDQTNFIKGRYIGENTRLLYDVMEYLNSERKTGLLLIHSGQSNQGDLEKMSQNKDICERLGVKADDTIVPEYR